MLRQIIDFLNQSDWIIGDPDIDFAKGGNKLPTTLKEAKQLIKRNNGRHK
jgi:hypothetical protein